MSEHVLFPKIAPFSWGARSVGLSVGLLVGLSVTLVKPAKTSEPIEMPLCLRTRVDPMNQRIRLYPDLLMERGNFGEMVDQCRVWGLSAVSCANNG